MTIFIVIFNQLNRMKNQKKKTPKVDTRPLIKLMIDYKTIISVRNKQALEIWMEKYPKAKVIA